MVLIDRGGRFYPPRYGFIALACQAIASCRLRVGELWASFSLCSYIPKHCARERPRLAGTIYEAQ
jgi:hypothetical protein